MSCLAQVIVSIAEYEMTSCVSEREETRKEKRRERGGGSGGQTRGTIVLMV